MFVTARWSSGEVHRRCVTRLPNAYLDITSHSRMSKMSEVEPVSIGRFDVYVEPYFDLDAIGILNADISLGRGHSFGLA